MRGWTIILLVVLVGWALLIGPPQSWGHLFEKPYSEFWKLLGPLVLYTYTAPGRIVLTWIWPGAFRLTLNQFFAGAPFPEVPIAILAWGFALTFSYFFWHFFGARFWKLIGRWNPFGWKITRHRPFFLRMFVRIGGWFERETKFGQHATGRFASLWDILSNEFKRGDIFLGRPKLIIGGMLRPIGLNTEKHFVTIASTGGYKSTGALIPNLCIHEGSALIIDPKGELAAITARRRGNGGGGVRGMGQPVYVLDPFSIVPGFTGASYNVFDEMERVGQYNPDRPVSYAGKVAQALIPATNMRDPYWDNAARTFITGLLLHILQGPKEHRNLVRLRTLLMEGDTESYRNLGVGANKKGDAFDTLMVMMQNCPEGPYRHVVAGAASSLSKMSSNQRAGVITTATEHTSFLDIPEFRKIMMKSDFLLEDLKNDFVSVYLCLPLNAVSGVEGHWLRMFVLLTVDMMSRVAKAPNPPLLMAIDEFPSLGKLDGIETVAPTMRSYGVRLWVIGQDLEQFEKVYPDSTGTLIGNAEAIQFMGVSHPPTVAYIAERLSEHVVTTQQDMGQGQVREVSTERALRDPDQVARMIAKDTKNQIVVRLNKPAMQLKICPYFEYMPWWYYSRDRRFHEKFNRWIWRWGKDNVPPNKPPTPPRPPKPPDKPPEPPKPPESPFFKRPEVDKETAEILSGFTKADPASRKTEEPWRPPARKPFEKFDFERIRPPEAVNGSDNVPGTEVTWDKALVNALERITDKLEQKADRKDLDAIRAEDRQTVESLREQARREQGGAYFAPVEKQGERVPAGGNSPSTKTPERPPERPPSSPGPRPPSSGGGPSKPPRGPLDEALAELDAMIGLAGVKQKVRKAMNGVELAQARKKRGLPDLGVTNHIVFLGNPGTGKTTVARIVGKIYKEMGLLAKGHMIECDRGALIGEYMGHTAVKTQKLINEALDGILFIDEAYTLAPVMASEGKRDMYGDEAIATLLKAMEDNRQRLVVIAAGYMEEMERFLNANPGLKSRFNTKIKFEDYSPDDMLKIFQHLGSKAGVRMSFDAQSAVSKLMESLDRSKKNFGNGRTVRNIFEECLARQGDRLVQSNGQIDVTIFEEADIPKPGEMEFD
jgi:stage V sporulation protein K